MGTFKDIDEVREKNGRTSTIVNIDVVDDTGRDIAQVVGTGFKLVV